MNSNDCHFRDGDVVRIKLKGIRMGKKENKRMRSVVRKIDEKRDERDDKIEITGIDNFIRLIREIKN